MRAREFILERNGQLRHTAKHAMTGNIRFRSLNDRAYNLNRVMMAAACADGKSTAAVDMPQASWLDRYNSAHPYTHEEYNMMKAAFATVDSEYEELVGSEDSHEPPGVNITSPIKSFQGYPR